MLDEIGMEARHIMTVSGHKSENSIRSYSKTSLQTKRQMSAVLSLSASLDYAPPTKKNFSFLVSFQSDDEENESSTKSTTPFNCDENIFFSKCTFIFQNNILIL